jgi:molybdate transport system ATP-binding protein
LLDVEIANDDTDFMDKIDTGRNVYQLVEQCCDSTETCVKLLNELDLNHLKKTGFRLLSSGETRRVMLARALAQQPELLILDEPFAGLDTAHRQSLANYLQTLASQIQLILIVSRETDIPDWVQEIALFSRGKLSEVMSRDRWNNHPIIAQLIAQSQQQSEQMMGLIRRHQYTTSFADPIFSITDGKVAYADKTIFSQLNWQINKGEHWQIRGPNGCGKSTLLALIFGDHPQCYSNQIEIFGTRRGSGETIWDIKQHIGIVSTALHLQYRVNCSALEVVISGFYDSIGLYQQPSKVQRQTATEWLTILHMQEFIKTPFRRLDYGQQRLLLIARALVKRPTLLILDEPYQGLDYLGRRLMMNTLTLIAKENLSQLLYVSHYQEDAIAEIGHHLDFVAQANGDGYLVKISK